MNGETLGGCRIVEQIGVDGMADEVTHSPTVDIMPPSAHRKRRSALWTTLGAGAAKVIAGSLLLVLLSGCGSRSPVFTPSADEWVDSVMQSIADRSPDYSDGFDNPESGWGSGSLPGGDSWGYQDGEYRMLASYRPRDDCCIGSDHLQGLLLTDFVLEIDSMLIEGEEGLTYLVIREDIREDSPPSYGVQLYSSGILGFFLNDGVNHRPLNDVQAATAVQGFGSGWNHLTIIAEGSRFAFLVNGDLVLETTDDTASRGNLAFGIENGVPDTWMEASFDNLRIWNLDR
jgi:hypothetical protein